MAHPLHWPGKYFFYPIGNTSPVCLTRDLAPEESADILLLGCGDPRNILYTILSEPQPVNRKLDFTCCDFEPAVLARNVLLFTLVADNQSYTIIWNFFFHFYLDDNSHSVVVEQCKKLINHSDSLQSWNSSPYGPFIKMCTAYTLMELRRHWSLYINLQQLPGRRLEAIRTAFKGTFKTQANESGILFSTARSTGPLAIMSAQILTEQCRRYWKSGVTFSDPNKLAAARHLNPTFAYSLDGEGCSVHYGTDPLATFHLAPLFGNAKGVVTMDDAVQAAQAQFDSWCSAFYISLSAPSVPTIRVFLGEATAVCCSLNAFATTSTLKLGVPVAQWKPQLIQLNKDDYIGGCAPALFNVIETSNMEDHMGLLNLLVATVPLLSPSTRSTALYVESLLFNGKDATKEFTERLHADITVMGLLLGITPLDYLSGFTSRSNVHELMTHKATKGNSPQFHQVTTWKSTASGDTFVGRGVQQLLPAAAFDSRQLGTLLYDMYHELFEHEDAQNFLRLNEGNLTKAVQGSNIIHYIRESFVLFLKLIKERTQIERGEWSQVMERFLDIHREDHSIKMDTLAFNDLCAQLYRHGVYTHPGLLGPLSKTGRFTQWNELTPVVRIILVVPREKLAVLDTPNVGTPLLQCDVRGMRSMNIFTSVHVAFGKVIPMGTRNNPRVVFEEDSNRRQGTMPLIASFVMTTWLLTDLEPMSNLKVSFSVRSTTGTVSLIPKLGLGLNIFTANFLDEAHVHVLPEAPLPKRERTMPSTSPRSSVGQIGTSGAVLVELDEQCELVSSLTSKISVDHEKAQALLRSAAVPLAVQVSPCVMRVVLGDCIQNVFFPFPVVGGLYKLRVARKSLCIEVVAPIYGPFRSGGMTLNPFPVVTVGPVINSWSFHRLNLSCLPILEVKGSAIAKWLDPHVGAMMSSRERSLRKKDANNTLMAVKDTIHSVLMHSSGVHKGPTKGLFAFFDGPTNNCDTVIFISELRFDLHSHTVVCDGYVLPLTRGLLEKMGGPFTELVSKGNIVSIRAREDEMRAWKLLLPALVERCRMWQHEESCEYKVQCKIPLAEEMVLDPLCSCGKGKNTEGMSKNALWKKWAPYVTRLALSPLFAVSYLETVGRDPARHRCFICRAKGKPKLLMCTVCQKVRYCSKECQKKDWKSHKVRCKKVA